MVQPELNLFDGFFTLFGLFSGDVRGLNNLGVRNGKSFAVEAEAARGKQTVVTVLEECLLLETQVSLSSDNLSLMNLDDVLKLNLSDNFIGLFLEIFLVVLVSLG